MLGTAGVASGVDTGIGDPAAAASAATVEEWRAGEQDEEETRRERTARVIAWASSAPRAMSCSPDARRPWWERERGGGGEGGIIQSASKPVCTANTVHGDGSPCLGRVAATFEFREIGSEHQTAHMHCGKV